VNIGLDLSFRAVIRREEARLVTCAKSGLLSRDSLPAVRRRIVVEFTWLESWFWSCCLLGFIYSCGLLRGRVIFQRGVGCGRVM
jgi:hypothetical protein